MANKCARLVFPLKEEIFNIFEDFSATLIANTKNFTFYMNVQFMKILVRRLSIIFLISSFLPVGVWEGCCTVKTFH